jgi:hypothetical protein
VSSVPLWFSYQIRFPKPTFASLPENLLPVACCLLPIPTNKWGITTGFSINTYTMPKTPRIKIPESVRKYVFERNNYQCQSCGKTLQETQLSIDHIVPLSKGGSNDLSNLQTLCLKCNQRKKHHFDDRFKRYYT